MVILWVAQALRAVDRMTPNATTTQAQLAGRTPTNLTTAGYGLPAFGVDSRVYRGAVVLEKRLLCRHGACLEAEYGVEGGSTASLSRLDGERIIRRWF